MKNSNKQTNTKINTKRNASLQIVMWLLVFMIGLSMLFILYPSNLNWGIKNDNSLAIGTAENPDYTINDEEDLLALSERRVSTTSGQDFTNAWGSSTESYYILLTKDLTMTVTTWKPIGVNSSSAFYGTFDGDGHTITFTQAITISGQNDTYGGVFGYVEKNSEISNLKTNWSAGVIVTSSSGNVYAGGIVGYASGIINNCYNLGSVSSRVIAKHTYVGGIVGYATEIINNCYNLGSVNATTSSMDYDVYAGGIVGSIYSTTIMNCCNIGDVSALDSDAYAYAGGILGGAIGGGTIINCYNKGSVNAEASAVAYAGGIAGNTRIALSANVIINNCYSTGSVSATSSRIAYIGGIASKPEGAITNCYYLEGCVENDSGAGGTAVSSEALQTQSTFTDWDFYDASTNNDGVWDINSNYNNGYPVLRSFYNVNITYQYDKNDNSHNSVQSVNLLDSPKFESSTLFTRPNYTYTQWTDGVNVYDCGSTITVTDDITLYPVWVLSAFTVTYDAGTNGGSFASASGYNNTVDVVAGQVVDLSTTNRYGVKSGWTFVGWNTDQNATSGLSSYTMPSNAVTLYAIYSKTITANFYQINGTNSVQSVTIYNNATQGTINIPSVQASAGQTAVGWTTSTTDTTPTISGTTINLSDNANYYAIVSYTVTISYSGNNGSGNTASTQDTAYLTANGTTSANTTNAQIQLANNAFSRPNYTFMGWSINSGATSAEYTAGQTYQFSSNTTLYAIWTKNTSTVDINITLNTPNANGIVIYIMNGTKDNYTSMTQIVVNSSQTVTLELMKDTAYTIIVSKPYIYTLSFSGGGAINNNSYTFMTANADTTTTQSVIISGATSGSGFNNSIII